MVVVVVVGRYLLAIGRFFIGRTRLGTKYSRVFRSYNLHSTQKIDQLPIGLLTPIGLCHWALPLGSIGLWFRRRTFKMVSQLWTILPHNVPDHLVLWLNGFAEEHPECSGRRRRRAGRPGGQERVRQLPLPCVERVLQVSARKGCNTPGKDSVALFALC